MSLDDILESPRLMMKLSFPPVMLQLMEEACKPEPDFSVMGEIISMDPALSTTILTLVNSPFYGLSQEISDLKRAAIVLGTRELLNLAVTITYQRHVSSKTEDDNFSIYKDWMLTLWGAIAAQLIATRVCPESADKIYLCCLLKDISLLFLRSAAPQEIPAGVDLNSVTLSYKGQEKGENDSWGMNHGALSQLLLSRWKMDNLSCPCIQHHHAIEDLDTFDHPTQAVILATRWAEMELGNDAAPFNVLQFEVLLQNALELDEDELEEFRTVCRTKFQSMLATLGMDSSGEGPQFYDHSIKSLQSNYFMSLELLTAEGGLKSIAGIIGRHLKLNWDIAEWELALKSPHTETYNLYGFGDGKGLSCVSSGCRKGRVPWGVRGKQIDIISRDILFGRFRYNAKGLSAQELKSLDLYFKFIGQAYEHYCAKQYFYEDRAETLESLPLGVASLDVRGNIFDQNSEMGRLLNDSGSGIRNFAEIFEKGLGIGLGKSWDLFLESESKKSFNKILCGLLRCGATSRDACIYISAYKQVRGEDHMISVVMEDIREISESQIQALKQKDFLEGLMDSMRDIVLSVDSRGNISYASARFSKIFLGRNLFDIATPADTFTGRWGPGLFEQKKSVVEVLLKRTDTAGRPFELVINRLEGDSGKHIIVARDLTHIRRLEEKLKRQAIFDGLTDLFNHTQFNTLLSREIVRSKRTGRLVGLLFFDLDGFKAVNDTKGHQAGDEVLKSVAEILKAELRAGMDFPCRYGGDEFAVIITEVRKDSLEMISNRIRLRINKKFSGKVTISGGLTVLQDGDTPAGMLSRADKATYEAKDLGGNVLVWAK